MEINKVIRIVITFMAVMAISIRLATSLLFDKPLTSSLPILVVMLICLGIVWRGTGKKQDSKK